MITSVSKRDKMLLGILAVIVVVAACYFLVFDPVTTQISEREAQCEELSLELNTVTGNKAAIASAQEMEKNVLSNIGEIALSYYPYVQSQYFADLLCTFSDELDLTVTDIAVSAPYLQNLSGIIPDEEKTDDPFANALKDVNKLGDKTAENSGSPAEDDAAPAKPGSILANKLAFSISNGSVAQYLAFLDKINKTPHPIYVSQYMLDVDSINNTLVMNVTIIILHIFSTIDSPEIAVLPKYSFEALPPAGSEHNFIYDIPEIGQMSDILIYQ